MHWPLSVVLEIFLFRLMQSFRFNWPFVLFISSVSFFWLHWTRKSWSYDVLLWTNIIKKRKNELHKLCLPLNHHPSNFHWVILSIKRFAFFFCQRLYFFSFVIFANCYSRFVCIHIYISDYINKLIERIGQNRSRRFNREKERDYIFVNLNL